MRKLSNSKAPFSLPTKMRWGALSELEVVVRRGGGTMVLSADGLVKFLSLFVQMLPL